MEPERWNRIERLYHAALECEPAGRTAFLTEACQDSDLRREVESLLGFDGVGGSMLERPAWEKNLHPGERLGPYEILDRTGKGGMGEVWKARDTRLDRFVAIKFSQTEFSDRFEQRSAGGGGPESSAHLPALRCGTELSGNGVRRGPLTQGTDASRSGAPSRNSTS